MHAFQGAEREVILFSPVYGRRHQGKAFFDQNKKMLNVAVSRAKDSFLVFGNMRLFQPALGTPSSRLGEFLFSSPENEITDIQPTLPLDIQPEGGSVIDSLEGHREILQEAFKTARRRLVIVSPYVTHNAIEADDILTQIRTAKARGVHILIFADEYFNERLNSKQFAMCVDKLETAGAKVFIARRRGIHCKVVCSDDHLFVAGSFNWLSAVRNENHKYCKYELSSVHREPQSKQSIEKLLGDLSRLCQKTTI